MASAGDLFIFYGVLKQGAAGGPTHIRLSKAGAFLGPCRFQAEMFDAGGYPGIGEGETICAGELYRLEDASILPALDEFEGCDVGDPAGSLYQRKQVAFFDGPSPHVVGSAWVYWFVAASAGMPVISSGVWPLEGRPSVEGTIQNV